MSSIYIDKEASPYFTELHAVCYINSIDIIAIKGTLALHNSKMKKSVKTINHEMRKIASDYEETDVITFIKKHLPMIPNDELQKAVDHFSSLDWKLD